MDVCNHCNQLSQVQTVVGALYYLSFVIDPWTDPGFLLSISHTRITLCHNIYLGNYKDKQEVWQE